MHCIRTKRALRGLVLFLASIGFAGVALAEDTGRVTIKRVVPWTSINQIEISRTVQCDNRPTDQIEVSATDSKADRNFDVAMSALLSGKEVDIRYTCNGRTAVGTTIRIYR